ncbi:MAG: sulfatase, partial [Candidatus Eisenbacteria bacterium]
MIVGLFVAGAGCGGDAPPPNVLLVILDTTRADVLSPYGGRAEMGTLDELAGRGVVFESVTTHNPFTLGSIATILTSLGPDLHGIKGHSGFALSPDAVTLAETLGAAGYESAAFVSAVPLRADTGIGQGYAHFDDDLTGNYAVYQAQFQAVQSGLQGIQRRGAETTRAAMAWLKETRDPSRPFFLTVHLYDPHEPYDPVPTFLQAYPDNPYIAEVASTDVMIRQLLTAIGEAGALGNTIVSVVADHGEAFQEHDEVGHGAFLYETTMRVPWILSGPGVPHCRAEGLARLVDVAPTLLSLCGVPAPPSFEGVDLMAEITQGLRGLEGNVG